MGDTFSSIKDGNVIARNAFCVEAIPWIPPGEYEPKKQASAKLVLSAVEGNVSQWYTTINY